MAEPVETRLRLKFAARRLFAQRGIDGVTVRDIVAESGQRNAASIFYYFGTKEALVRELIVDGAKAIDERRNAALDELERQGAEPDLRTLVTVLIRTSFDPDAAGAADTDRTFLRFIAMLQTSHRSLFLDALDRRWNSGYLRLQAQIRRLLQGLPPPVLNQRLIFMSVYLGQVLAVREAAMADPGRTASSLRSDLAIENLVDTLAAMLAAPPSPEALSALPGTPA